VILAFYDMELLVGGCGTLVQVIFHPFGSRYAPGHGKSIVGDDACKQIEQVLPGLTSITSREGGWTKLFRDPRTGVFWELTYPQSHLHGGGPLRLESLSVDEVDARYPNADLA
jgi:hypothetical protein